MELLTAVAAYRVILNTAKDCTGLLERPQRTVAEPERTSRKTAQNPQRTARSLNSSPLVD